MASAQDDDIDAFDLEEAMLRSIAATASFQAGGLSALTAETLKQNLQDTDFYNQFSNILDLSDVVPTVPSANAANK